MSAPPPEQPPTATRRRRGRKGDPAPQPQRGPEGPEGSGIAEPPKLRRRPMLIALSVLLTALGALLGAWLLTGFSGTKSYIAVKNDIARGETIEAEDLVRTQLRADNAVAPVAWDDRRTAIGQPAAVDMAAGSIVTRKSLGGELVPSEGHSVVGLALDPGQAPTRELQPGDPVRVVIIGEEGTGSTTGASEAKPGKVTGSSTSPDGSIRYVDVMVVTGDANTVSSAAARRQVSLVVDSRANGTDLSEPVKSPASSDPSPSSSPSS